MATRHHFQVDSATPYPSVAELISILGSLFGANFALNQCHSPHSNFHVFRSVPNIAANPSGSTLQIYCPDNDGASEQTCDISVCFADRPEVPLPFRGRSLTTKAPPRWVGLSLQENEVALAVSDRGPVWTMSHNPIARRFRSGIPLPTITKGRNLIDGFNGDQFIGLLPLMHWLREMCEPGHKQPPLTACFIIDDPNLHWPTYGYVHYRELAARAASLKYHVAFATIPLDSWFAHRATVNLFKTNQCNISLAIHGNDHSYCELAKCGTRAERTRILAQAIRRIERLERQTGLHICRVMIPPHGACSEEMLATLPEFGFAAACISHGSLRAHNKNAPWTKTMGYLPYELIGGCPVLPRLPISRNNTNAILLAAYLGQPILVRGHHNDFKNGLDRLDEYAAFINTLGPVTWTDLSALCRMNNLPACERHTLPHESTFPDSFRRPPIATVVRRILTEARDRFLP